MTEDDDSPSSSSEIDRILVDYFRRIDAGEQISVGKFVAEYPDQAATLSDLLYADGKIRARVDDAPDPHHTPTLIGVSAKSAAQAAGSVLRYFGDYELLEEIARGGMGVVYKARQTSLNRTVAIKMILAGNLADENDVKRFHREAEAAANLQHANIVQIFEVGEQADQHYYAMEFVDGQSLADMVRDHPLSVREAATIVRQVANAIEYAHQQGVLHRDLKPANVLVDGRGGIKVTDFGLAKHLEGADQLTTTGQIVGTPSYMPPEQAAGNQALTGPASDVYSLGAVLYQLLTGRPPFAAATPMKTLHQVLEHEPLSPRVLDPEIPKDLATICLKCLRKEPNRRYGTALELAEDLTRWLQGKPIEGRPVGRIEKVQLWCRRKPAIAGMIAAILLIAVVATGLILLERQHNQAAIAASEALSEFNEILTTVEAMSMARGAVVPYVIKDLDEFPRDLVLATLRDEFDAADGVAKLPLAYALAYYGDVRTEYLVSQVEGARPDESDNLAAALGDSVPESIAGLETAARTAGRERNWRHNARLAMLALHLKAPSLAQEMCRSRPNPVSRTQFIEECSTWHGDLSKLSELVADSADVPLRSAVALAVGSVPIVDLSTVEKQAWQPVLSNWYATAPDTLTHSAAGWALRKWKLKLPDVTKSQSLADGLNWSFNSVGMTMLKIPAGKFVRRIVAADPADVNRLITVDQTVTLTRSSLMADREVTRAQFRQFMDDPECSVAQKPEEWQGAETAHSPSQQHPVQQVNWYDAVLFCNWLSRKEGLTAYYLRTGEKVVDGSPMQPNAWQPLPDANGYRLPTEAEWEFACRAGTDSTYSHGEDPSLLDQYEVIRFYGTQHPGSKLPNCWGLFDVQGNVQEWCHDWYEPFGIEAAATDPFGPIYGQSRIQRGGSFRSSMSKVRPSVRSMVPPLYRGFDTGFRVVRTKTGEVTLVRFNNLPITDVGLEQVIELTSLAELELTNTQITDVGLQLLKGLVRLKKLWVDGTPITDAGLVHLKGLASLEDLRLGGTPITDAGLAHLKGLASLENLRLADTPITDAGLVHLKELTSLTKLGLGGTPITDAGLLHLKGVTRLTRLALFGTQITDIGLEHLKELTCLEVLWLGGTQVTDKGLVHLKGMTRLTRLSLGGTQITDVGLGHLKGLTSLEYLRLYETQITDAGLEHLKELTSLEWLELSSTQVTDAGLVHLKELTSLTHLELSGTRVTDAGWSEIKAALPRCRVSYSSATWEALPKALAEPDAAAHKPLPKAQAAAVTAIKRLGGLIERDDTTGEVTLVRFNDLPITDVGLEQILELTSLTELELNNTQITDAGLQLLKGLVRLEKLWVDGTPITDSGLVHLKELTCLTQLGLRNTKITDAGLERLKGLTSLTQLNLILTQVTDSGLEHLKGLTSLTQLGLSNPQITDVGLEHLKELTRLEDLWLHDTQVTDKGLEHLKGLTSLTRLGLGKTQITDAGLVHLKGRTCLEVLWLGGTQVTDKGLEHLKGLTSLEYLRLYETQITDAGLEHLKELTSLELLELSSTPITDAGLLHLKGLTSLTSLTVHDTQVTDVGLAELKIALPDCEVFGP